MIDFYCNNAPAGEHPYFHWRNPDGYLCRLVAVVFSQNARGVWNSTPIYRPLFVIERHGRSWHITIHLKHGVLIVSGARNQPLFTYLKDPDDLSTAL